MDPKKLQNIVNGLIANKQENNPAAILAIMQKDKEFGSYMMNGIRNHLFGENNSTAQQIGQPKNLGDAQKYYQNDIGAAGLLDMMTRGQF